MCEAWYSREGFTESNFPASSIHFGEIASVLSEWLFGLDGMVGNGSFEVAYDQSLVRYLESSGGKTYHARCLCDDDLSHCCPYHDGHPYVQYSLFGIYLHNRLPYLGQGDGSFFQDWLHKLDGSTYLHDLRGLAALLEDDACDGLFPGIAAGNERLKAMVHAWQAAKFLNWTGGSGEGDLLQWQHDSAPGGDHRTPQMLNLFRTPDPYCWNDIEAVPPYHVLGSGESVSREGFLKYSDLFEGDPGCDALGPDDQYLHHRRFVEVSTFAANYIVLLPTSGTTAEFIFSPSFSYVCADCAHDSEPEALFHALSGPLEVDITAYGLANLPAWSFDPVNGPYLDEAVNLPGVSVFKLQGLRIPEVELGRDYLVSVDLAEHGLAAVVFVISCADPVCDDGDMIAEFVPYSYSLAVDPGHIHLSPSITGLYEIGPGQTRWMEGPITIGATGTLVIKAGGKLFAEAASAQLTVNSVLELEGSESATSRIAASPDPEDNVTSWTGISVAAGGAFRAEHAALGSLNTLDLSAMAGSATLASSELTFDGGASSHLSTPRTGTIGIQECSIANLNHIEMRDGIIANSALRQRETVFPLVLPEAFVRVAADQQAINATISGSSIQAVDVPVRIGGSAHLTDVVLNGANRIELYGAGLAYKPVGLWIRSNSSASVDGLEMELNPSAAASFRYGVRVEGNSTLVMRNSEVIATSECVSVSTGTAALDLGRDLPNQWGGNTLMPAIEELSNCRKDCWDHDANDETPDVCVEHIIGTPGRVIYNRSSSDVFAQRNELPLGLNPPEVDIGQVCFGKYVRSAVPGTEVLVYPRNPRGQETCPGPGGGCDVAFAVIGGGSADQAARPVISVSNPSVGGILLRAEDTGELRGGSIAVAVYDIAGRRVVERRIAMGDESLDTSGILIRPSRRPLPSGVYLVRVSWDGGSLTQKTVVLK